MYSSGVIGFRDLKTALAAAFPIALYRIKVAEPYGTALKLRLRRRLYCTVLKRRQTKGRR